MVEKIEKIRVQVSERGNLFEVNNDSHYKIGYWDAGYASIKML